MDYFISCQLNTGVIKQMRESVLVKYRKSQKGFSLLELLLVLGIVAALIVASFIGYPKVRDARYVDIEAKHIGQIYASVRNVYAGQPDYSGLATTAVAIPAQFFPDDMLSKILHGEYHHGAVMSSLTLMISVHQDWQLHHLQ